MTTGKALNGKPYAGNPHVRFDEGEVASAATPRRGSLLYNRMMKITADGLVLSAVAQPAHAAQNCISNGDFETDRNGNVSAFITWGYERHGNQYVPADWTFSDRNHMGLVNEGTDRHNVYDTMGTHSLAIERYKGTSNLLEARQSFSIPAPGTYRLTLLYTSWNSNTDYSHLRTFAQLIQPGGVVTNQLNSFTPHSYDTGLESVASFMADTPTLAAYGSDNDYTLSFYATDTYKTDYAYCIIDNVSFSLRTLILGENETFTSGFGLEPHDMNLGAGSALTYAPTAATAEIVPGTVTFASGAKIVFDMANATAGAYVLRTGGFVLPEGANDPLAFIEIANAGDYALSLIEDGKAVRIAKASAPLAVTWTGGGSAANLLDAANWSAVPDASTLTITLGASADWRGLGALTVSPAATIDMNGNALKLSGLSSAEFAGAAITNSASGAAAELTVDVADGESVNTSVALLGNIRLVKEGAGTLKASKASQTYWGGTAVNGGTLKAGIHGKFRPFGAAEKNLIVNGDFEANSLPDSSEYLGTAQVGGVPDWTIPNASDTYLFNTYLFWSNYNTHRRDPQYEWYKWALCLGKDKSASQTFRVEEPGVYRLAFEYSTWMGYRNYDGSPTAVTVKSGDGTLFEAMVTPVKEVGYRQFFANVEIAEAGDYTLEFAATSTGSYFHVDKVSFAKSVGIEVASGATLDMNGREGCGAYAVTVASGGTLLNANGDVSADRTGLADVTLTGDSTLSVQKNYALSGYAPAIATLDLGGKTLTVTKATGKFLTLRDAEVKNGTIVLPDGGWLQTAGNGVDAVTVDLDVTSALQIDAPFTVRNYAAHYTKNNNGGSAALNVVGTFTPGTAYFYGCTMQDGSTIDLSEKTEVWSTTSSFSGGKKTVDFAPEATVNIEVGARELAIGDKVVAWTAMPPVEDNVLFALTRNGTVSETQALAVQDDGLYVKRAAEPAYAMYDVANDALRFYTAGDAEVTDWDEGVTGNMQVRFSSYAEYVAIAATNLTPSAFVLTGDITLPAGTGDVDLTAIPFEFPANMTIDLNGRALRLSEAMMGGARPFTVTSSVAGGVLVADVAGDVNNTSMSLAGPVKLLKTGTGTFTASKANQTYTGGTEVTNGVLKCGINGYVSNNTWPFGGKVELLQNGSFDADAGASWHGATGWTAWPGNWCGRQSAGSYCSKKLPAVKFAMVGASQKNGGNPAQFYQAMEIVSPGMYRYSFDHARGNAANSVGVDVLLVKDSVERLLVTVTPQSVDSFTRTTGHVPIAEAGTYTLKFAFHRTPSGSTADCYNVFDNVSFSRLPEVKVSGGDAVLEMNGKYWLYDNNYVLAGGTVRNSGGSPADYSSKIQFVELAADSSFDFVNAYGIWGESATQAWMVMGGRTLTAVVGDGQVFVINSTVMVGEGKVSIPVSTGTLKVSGTGGNGIGVMATNVDFSVGCALNLATPMAVRGYEALYEGTANAGTAALNVFGTFRPVTSNYYGCALQDGATLDLSGWQGGWPWSVTSAFATGANTVSFAEDATIKVRRGAKGGKIVSWTEETTPPASVTFVRDPADTRPYSIVRKDDGLYVVSGLTIIVR